MPTPTYVPLATLTLTGNDSSITFSGIPATYRDLVLVSNQKANAINESFILLNGSSSDFSGVRMIGSSSGVSSNTYSSNFGAVVTETDPSIFILQFLDYSATDKHKPFLVRQNRNGSIVAAVAFRWANTAAINSITITPNPPFVFVAGATFSLYGVN